MTHGCPECGSMGSGMGDPCTCPPLSSTSSTSKTIEQINIDFSQQDSSESPDEDEKKVDEFLDNVKAGEFRFFDDCDWVAHKVIGYNFLDDAFYSYLEKIGVNPSEENSGFYEVSYINSNGEKVKKRICAKAEWRWSGIQDFDEYFGSFSD